MPMRTMQQTQRTIWPDGPVYNISVLFDSASIEGSGESAHMRRLVRALTDRIHKEWMWMVAHNKS